MLCPSHTALEAAETDTSGYRQCHQVVPSVAHHPRLAFAALPLLSGISLSQSPSLSRPDDAMPPPLSSQHPQL